MSLGACAAGADLTLDSRLKLWVLLPISVVMILVGIVRRYLMILLTSKVKSVPRATITENQYISKAIAMLTNGSGLHEDAFRMRQEYLAGVLSEGKYLALKGQASEPQNMLSDPNMSEALMSMAKGNLAGYIPQTVIMWWVNYFFAGFVLMKLPFPLTMRFKEMLQSGVMTADLDARWVSSISWYFISMFGLDPVYNLLFGDEASSQSAMQQQMFVGGSVPGGPTPEALMKNYANDLTIAQYESCFDGIEDRVLRMYTQ
ncbi:AaceriAFR429Cp [[Ashbya] aceris (nom. inval.)]|nr:AaceriAFR429Cp [[Ashbya] aceris (nom. inval.)]